MSLQDYMGFLAAMLVCMIFTGFASAKVRSSFEKYNKVPCRAGITGHDAAVRLLRSGGVTCVKVGRIQGQLTDHYHPSKEELNLSDSTYGSTSVAAVAVAAHEVGHVMQKHRGYSLFGLRTALVPLVNFGSRLAMPLVLVGLLLHLYAATANAETGFYVAMAGVILYGSSLLFALVTLPVELNASRRAKQMLLESGILSAGEMDGASQVLSAAAMTYLASVFTSLVYFLRFLLQVLSLFGRRRD